MSLENGQIDPSEPSALEGIARRLREARESLGLSQEDVAKALGLTRPSVSALEGGKRRVTSTELKELAKLFRRDYAYLLDGEMAETALDTAIFRTASGLSESDKAQVLKFAQFLQTASRPPSSIGEKE